MRENMGLYRGKRKVDGKWAEGSYLHLNIGRDFICDGTVWIGTLEPCKVEVIPETVGECSGDRDKHGKLIFEDDIVQHMVNGKLLRGKVEYADGAFGVRIITGGAQFLCFFVDDTCEVIGNIHDNPELLEVK